MQAPPPPGLPHSRMHAYLFSEERRRLRNVLAWALCIPVITIGVALFLHDENEDIARSSCRQLLSRVGEVLPELAVTKIDDYYYTTRATVRVETSMLPMKCASQLHDGVWETTVVDS